MKEKKLFTLLQKKKGFFEAILELVESETNLPLSDWLATLQQKKILLSCIEEIDQELHHFKDSFYTLSQEISDELEEIKKVVGKIKHLESRSQEKRKIELSSYDKGKVT